MTVDGDVGRDLAFTQVLHKAFDIEPLVAADRDPPSARPMTVDEVESRLTFSGASRRRDIARHREPVAVLHQYVTHVAKPALLAVTLAIELGIGIGRGGMGFIRTLLPAEVALAVSPTVRRRA